MTGFLSVSPTAAQKPPDFLAAEAPAGRVTTAHLEAVLQQEARVDAVGRAEVSIRVTPAPKMHVYAPDVTGAAFGTMRMRVFQNLPKLVIAQ